MQQLGASARRLMTGGVVKDQYPNNRKEKPICETRRGQNVRFAWAMRTRGKCAGPGVAGVSAAFGLQTVTFLTPVITIEENES